MRIAIFDIDGVLVIPLRFYACVRESLYRGDLDFREVLTCFCSCKYVDWDVPNYPVISYVKKLRELGYRIVIVTGRFNRSRRITEEQLGRIGVEYDLLLCSPFNTLMDECRVKEILYREVLREFSASADNVVEVHDDSERVLELARKMFKKAVIVHHQATALAKLINSVFRQDH